MKRRARVAVIGLGSVGSMTFWQLARRGIDVVGFEQFACGHPYGGAGGDNRLYRILSENPRYVPITRAAKDDWRALERDSGIDLLTTCGELYIAPESSAWMSKVLGNASAFGIDHSTLTPAQSRAQFPTIPVGDADIVVLERESGYVQAGASIAAAAHVGAEKGGTLLEHCAVTAVESTDDGVLITTADSEWLVDSVVVTTGAWANRLLGDRLPMFDVRRASVHWYPLRTPVGYTPDVYPIVERGDVDFGFAVWPTTDRQHIKVALMSTLDHRTDADDLGHTMPKKALDLIDSYVAEYVPDAIPTAIRHAFGVDACTQDGDFVVGPTEDDPRIVLGLGMNIRGFKMAAGMGRALADLASTGSTDIPLDGMSVRRFQSLPTVV
ncbi:FAD-dependent oxidoreductase [Rhodococcus sovatensis]|uniref:FAD-dependent oxidoreductase n=1 Tax=Rhodococcus sovatensis TaxID=1805840 RepID=A0ABZ2PHX3_9NOCA